MSINTRLDELLIELGHFSSIEETRTAIMSNKIYIAGKVENKAGSQINKEKFLEKLELDPGYLRVVDDACPYVSRGGYKLVAAINEFKLELESMTVFDLGASTGGFTDCALQHGASRVIAFDVGKAQLDYKLRQDPRVLCIEEENFRNSDLNSIAERFSEHFNVAMKIDLIAIDLSFISILTVTAKLKELITKYGHAKTQIVLLLKPQFEAPKNEMDKCKGVIRNAALRERVLNETLAGLVKDGFTIAAQTQSPISGAKGNIEYLILLSM